VRNEERKDGKIRERKRQINKYKKKGVKFKRL